MRGLVLGLSSALLWSWLGSAGVAEVKSGLQVGESPAAFTVRDITGPSAGTSLCYT